MSITSARKGLAVDLREALPTLTVYDHVPSAIDTDNDLGTVVVEPSEDYAIDSDTLRRFEVEVAVDLYVLVAYAGENDTASDNLDAALSLVLAAMPPDWLITATGKPGPQTNGEWLAYGIRLTATTITDL